MAGTASAGAGRRGLRRSRRCLHRRALAPAALAEVERQGGAFPGDVAVVALGKCGSREMTAGSDLDLMTLYEPTPGRDVSATKGWAAETFYGRFTQRLITALSAPTAEGELYEVDMQLRPSGTKGPVAVSFAAFDDYYAGEAETWEYLALTRARVAWAIVARVRQARRRGDRGERCARRGTPPAPPPTCKAMRELMARERPPSSFWDFKLIDGGLVDIEFAAQFLQLIHAASRRAAAAEHSRGAGGAGRGAPGAAGACSSTSPAPGGCSRTSRSCCASPSPDDADPDQEPRALRAMMAKVAGVRDHRALRAALTRRRQAAHRALYDLLTMIPAHPTNGESQAAVEGNAPRTPRRFAPRNPDSPVQPTCARSPLVSCPWCPWW